MTIESIRPANLRLLQRTARLGAALLLAAGFLWLVYLGLTFDLRGAAGDRAAAFAPIAVVRGDLRETVVATGTLEPFARIVVQSEIPGIVARVHADDGERVARGEPLVELSRDRLEDRVAELRASFASRVALARVNLVGRAQAEQAKAERDLRRTRELFDRGIASQMALDQALYLSDLSRIDLEDARAETDARAAARTEAAKALQRVERDLSKAIIRSPVDGVVVRREVEVGTAVADLQNGGTVVAILADDQRLHVLAEVDENDVAKVRVGQESEVRIDAFPDEVFIGTVRKISSSANEADGVSNFEVEIGIDADPRIRVGMSADTRIVVREHADALLVPNTALVRDREGLRVRLVADGADRPQLVAVEEAYSDGFHTALVTGVREGDVLLVRRDGAESWER